MSLTADEKAKLEVVSKKAYHEQAQFFLNAFWNEFKDNTEQIWGHWQKLKELDKQQWNALCAAGKAQGDYVESTSLDEFWSHKFLENIGKTMSIVDFRKEFQKIDANTDKRMGFIEFLVYEYKVTVPELLSRPQGGDPEELARAQKLLEEVSTAFAAAQKALDQASATEAEAKRAKEAAIKSEQQAKATAAEAKKQAELAAAAAAQAKKTAEEAAEKAAQAKKTADEAAQAAKEQQDAVDALKKEEDTYNNRTKELQVESEKGGVSGMKAKNELAQHLSKDPLPLSKAKLTAEAAKKKTDKANAAAQAASQDAEKAKKKAEDDANAAEQSKKAADKAQKDAEEAAKAAEADRVSAEAAAAAAETDRVAAEQAVKDSEAKLAEAEAYLNEVKSKSDKTYGTFWWLDRELAERKKYMPKSGRAKLLF